MLWRSPDSVHLEIGARAVVIEGLPAELVRRIASPLPPREPGPPLEAGHREALSALVDAGYLWRRSATSADDARRAVPAARSPD